MSNLIRPHCATMFHSAPMATREVDEVRAGIGMRLKAAREAANLTQDAVASRFSVGKGTVSAWETGRGDPGVSRLRELAKLYKVSADAILWENALTNEALQLAADFDGLNERQQRTLKHLWMAFLADSKDDDGVEQAMPITKEHKAKYYTEEKAK